MGISSKSESHRQIVLFFTVFALASCLAVEATSSSNRQLVKGRVIPDVLDLFVPTAKLKINYGRTRVVNGLLISPSAAAKAPSFEILARSRRSPVDLYTLIVADPDAPSPDNPIRREILHWLVVNIPRKRPLEGEVLVPYAGPAPPLGIHRYVFSLYKQNKVLKGVKVPEGRALFRTRGFTAANELGLPIAAVYFNSTKEMSS
ncbi:protein MOTHER of FT and TFL1 homolog 1-like [Wolffia australiana]